VAGCSPEAAAKAAENPYPSSIDGAVTCVAAIGAA